MMDKSSTITIRRAHLSDVPAILRLHEASVPAPAPAAADHAPAQIGGFLALEALDRWLVWAGTYYLAEIDGAIIGTGGWSASETLPVGLWVANDIAPRSRYTARIRGVFVHPDWACDGIGRRLVQHVETEAARAGFTAFELVSSLAGEMLYRSLGYDALASVTADLSTGAVLPGIYMRKVLSAPAEAGPGTQPAAVHAVPSVAATALRPAP